MKLVNRSCLAGVVFAATACITAPLSAATLSVLPLGDSITSGYAYYTMGPGYRAYLLNDLANNGISIKYQGVQTSDQSNDYGYSSSLVAQNQNNNDGFPGYGSADILNNLAADTPSISTTYSNAGGYWITGGNGNPAIFPNIVLLIIGNNDMGGRGGAATIDPNDLAILNWFNTNRPDTEVIIAAPPPGTGATDLPQTELVNAYLNTLIPAQFPQDRVADVYQAQLYANGTLNTTRISPDGLHPLNTGYIGIAEALYASIAASVPNTSNVQVQIGPFNIAGTLNAWTSQLDLQNHDAIVVEGDLATITDQIKSGCNQGSWTGAGIISTAAATDSNHLMALGAIQNFNTSAAPLYSTFDGIASTTDDVLIKFTTYGDANLDNTVDGSDYSLLDNGYLNHLTGWYNGDFNYDGIINGSDYTLIDNAATNQGAQGTASINTAIGTAQIATPTAIPEPAMLTLLTLASLRLRTRRQRAL